MELTENHKMSTRSVKCKKCHKFLLMLLFVICSLSKSQSQHEDIPYENIESKKICSTCICFSGVDANSNEHKMLNCVNKNFKHILARWPDEFDSKAKGTHIVASFSGNSLEVLQQLPATNVTVSFSCLKCKIRAFQVPTFMDVPNIKHLDLSWNEITTEELTPDVFRGPYKGSTHYEPIALTELKLSHNKLHSLDRKLFEHTPNISKLDLSHNQFKVFDIALTSAVASAVHLKILDLSFTGLKTVPDAIFKALSNLNTLNLENNELSTPPSGLKFIGKTLATLKLSGNLIEELSASDFLGLKVLKYLNVSDLTALNSIQSDTFLYLETLEYLYCSHNSKLNEFFLDGLINCSNLTHLDISFCHIKKLTTKSSILKLLSNKNASESLPWPKLRSFNIMGNPWLCNCELFELLEFVEIPLQQKNNEHLRCENPYMLAGAQLTNLTAKEVCSMKLPKKYNSIEEDPPRFLRKRYIILTAITAAVVIVVGLLIGFLISCIRRRLTRNNFGVEPIRYTSVRSSNLSAFSHTNPNAINTN